MGMTVLISSLLIHEYEMSFHLIYVFHLLKLSYSFILNTQTSFLQFTHSYFTLYPDNMNRIPPPPFLVLVFWVLFLSVHSRYYIKNIMKWMTYKQRKLFFILWGTVKFNIKALACLVPGEGLFPHSEYLSSPLSSHGVSNEQNFPQAPWAGPPFMTFLKPFSYTTLRAWNCNIKLFGRFPDSDHCKLLKYNSGIFALHEYWI